MFGQGFNYGFLGKPPCFTDTTDIFKDNSGVALYTLDYDASDAGGASGKFNEGAIFNGTSSYIQLPALPITVSNDITFSAWVKSTNNSTDSTIVSTLGENGLELRVQNSAVRAVYRKGGSWYASSTVSITANAWNHVVLTYEQGVGFNIYVNNNTPTTYSETGTLQVLNSNATDINTIGRYADGSSGYFDGSIDQVRIYNTALTQSQVTQLYQENASTLSQHLFGCLATYNFNGSAKESLGTTAYDGTETDITYRYDGTPTAVDFGVGGKSLYGAGFNGSNSSITLPVGLGSSGNRSRSFWINVDNLDNAVTIFYLGNSSSNAYYETCSVQTNGKIRYQERHDTSTNSVSIDSSSSIAAGIWYNVVYVFSGSVRTLYINGVQEAQTTSSYATVNNIAYPGFIGSFRTAVTNTKGKIDQVRLFNKALSSSEISKLYGNGAGEIACTHTSTTDNIALPITNTAYYKLDNNSKDSARSTGKFNEGAIFNGSSSKISTTINNSDVESFSLWFYFESGTTVGRLLGSNVGSNAGNLAVEVATNGAISAQLQNLRYAAGSGALGSTGWKHIYYDTNRDLYINGTLHTGGTDGTDSFGNSTVLIGALRTNYGFINTAIDQIRFYDATLSSADVSNLYAETASDTSTLSFPPGQTAIATYTFDGNSTDLSGNYNGTDTNVTYAYDGTDTNIEYRFGRFGQAAVFNGSSSVITINSLFDFSSSFSISMWFNADALPSSTYVPLFVTDGYGGSNSDYGFALYLYGNTIKPWIDRQGTYTNIFTAGTLSVGTWYHVALNRDYNSEWELFLNGSSLGTYTGAGLTDNYTPSSFSTIGKHANSNMWFDGKIDQVRIYDAALTSSQVTELYNEKPEVDTSNFKTVLWDGTSAENYISQVGMDLETNGGLVWIKQRSLVATNHRWFDSIRGATQIISSSTTDAQGSNSETLKSFEANGFVLGTNTAVNDTGDNFVAWNWKGGGDAVTGTGTGVTNVSVSANTEAGFSIVKYTGGNSASDTVNHGLTDAEMIILKDLDDGTNNWRAWHKDLTSGHWLYLNLTNAQASAATDGGIRNVDANTFGFINGTTGGVEGVNSNASDYIAYVWKSISGYSKIGSYEGLGTSDVTVSGLGFKPSFIIVKNADATSNWNIYDTARGTIENRMNNLLYPNLSNAESGAAATMYITVNDDGFVVNNANHLQLNYNGDTFIYMAIK